MNSAKQASDKSNTVVLLDENHQGTVRLVPLNRDQFCLSIQDAIKACRALASSYTVFLQIGDLRERLGKWIEDNRSSIQAAYLSFRPDGILFVVMQKQVERDDKLVEALSDLDIEIASSEQFNELTVDVLSIPRSSVTAATAFLSSGHIHQEYAGQERPHNSGE